MYLFRETGAVSICSERQELNVSAPCDRDWMYLFLDTGFGCICSMREELYQVCETKDV